MRLSTAAERALIAARRFRWALKVEMQGFDGAWRELSDLGGRNFVNGSRWRWNLDVPVMGGELTLHRAMRGGSIISNPDFDNGSSAAGVGTGGYAIYDNNGTGLVSIGVEQDPTAPNDSGYRLRVQTNAGAAPAPGLGGFTVALNPDAGTYAINSYHRGATIYWHVWALIPVGYTINWASNATGTDAIPFAWLTDTAGTGQWKEYIGKITIGTVGTFAATGYFWLNGSTRPVVWYVAKVLPFDPAAPMSLSPLMASSMLNMTGVSGAAGPQVDARRRVRISTATLPPGVTTPRTVRNELFPARDLTSASWSKSVGLGTALNAVGIDGAANTATTLTDNDAANFLSASESRTIANDLATHTLSVWFAKDAVATRFPQVKLVLTGGTTVVQRAISINTVTGATGVNNSSGVGTFRVVDGATVSPLYAGFWILEITCTNNLTGNTTASAAIFPAAGTVIGVDSAAATGSAVVGHAQLELNTTRFGVPVNTTTAAVTGGDWREVFDGYTDKYSLGGKDPVITIPMRDIGALLQDTIVEVERIYGSTSGVDGAVVMQQILNDNAGILGVSITLSVPVAIPIAVFTYKLTIGTTIMDALNAIARNAGAVVRYKYNAAGVMVLTFYTPDRTKVVPDAIYAASEYLSLEELEADAAGLRNIVFVPFTDSGPGGTGARLVASAQASSANLLQYGHKAMVLGQEATSQINTLAEANALAAAAVADTAYPYATARALHDLTWYVEGGDLLRYLPDMKHADANLDIAVMQIEHSIQATDAGVTARSTITGRPNVAALYQTWLRLADGTGTGPDVPPALLVVDTPGGTPAAAHSVAYSGIYDSIELSTNGGAWGTPSASPLSITPNPAGGVAKVLVFRATKGSQQTTQTITIPAAGGAALPPLVVLTQSSITPPSLSTETLTVTGQLGLGGAGPLLWRFRVLNSNTVSAPAFPAFSATPALPVEMAVTRALKWEKTIEVQVQDAAGVISQASYVVESRMDAMTDNGIIDDGQNMSSGTRPFRRAIDSAADVVITTTRAFVDPNSATQVDASGRIVGVFRLGVFEPVNNLVKAGDALGATTVSSLTSGLIIVNANAGLPAATGTVLYIASGFASPTIGRIFVGDGTGWQLEFVKRTGGVTTLLVSLADNGNFFAQGALAGERYISARAAGAEKVYYGVATSANDLITGSTIYDACLRAVTAASRFLFSTDNGATIGAEMSPNGAFGTKGQIRATGWFGTGDRLGLGLEIGISGGAGFVYAYNRTSNTWADVSIGGASVNLTPQGGSAYVDDGSTTKRQIACVIISSVAPTTETAPEGTIWIQT